MVIVHQIDIPILVVAFNRPNHVEKLLQLLVDHGVRRVFVSIDGPRDKQDVAKCNEVLKVTKIFSDKMKITVLHRSHNLGCGLGVTAAIDWFFSYVDLGIILEDDCLPKEGFFEYFKNYFTKIDDYKSRGVSMASAHNPFHEYQGEIISNYFLIYGWGTTSDTWRSVRQDFFKLVMPRFSNQRKVFRSPAEGIYWWANATRARLGSVDTWDSIFCDRMWALGMKCLIPSRNLIQNNGFGEGATHTKDPAGGILIRLQTETLSSMNFDLLLKRYYFKIRPRHMVTPFLKVIKDCCLVLFGSRIEVKLERDLGQRVEIRL